MAQIEHFIRCGRCFQYLWENRRPPHSGEAEAVDRLESEQQWSELHPFLEGFVNSAKLAWRLEGARFPASRDSERSYHIEFDRLIGDVGMEVREQFLRYLAETRRSRPDLIDDYLHRNDAQERRGASERPISVDDRTEALDSGEPIEHSARRLAESVWLAVETGFYDELIAEQPQIARFLSILAMESPENLAQLLAFLSWLRGRERGLTVTGNIPGCLEISFDQKCGSSAEDSINGRRSRR